MKTKQIKTLFGILTVFVALFVFAGSVSAADVNLPPVVNKALESRVLIMVSAENVSGELQGTGFVASRGYVVSCDHLFSAFLYYTTREKMVIKISKDDKSPTTTAKIVASDPSNDLTLLRVDEPGKIGPPAKLASVFPNDGETVYSSGFWLNGSFKATLKSVLLGKIEKAVYYDGYLVSNLAVIDRAIFPGFSGGPVFNEKGEVVGMNLATTPGASLILVIDPIKNILKEVK